MARSRTLWLFALDELLLAAGWGTAAYLAYTSSQLSSRLGHLSVKPHSHPNPHPNPSSSPFSPSPTPPRNSLPGGVVSPFVERYHALHLTRFTVPRCRVPDPDTLTDLTTRWGHLSVFGACIAVLGFIFAIVRMFEWRPFAQVYLVTACADMNMKAIACRSRAVRSVSTSGAGRLAPAGHYCTCAIRPTSLGYRGTIGHRRPGRLPYPTRVDPVASRPAAKPLGDGRVRVLCRDGAGLGGGSHQERRGRRQRGVSGASGMRVHVCTCGVWSSP